MPLAISGSHPQSKVSKRAGVGIIPGDFVTKRRDFFRQFRRREGLQRGKLLDQSCPAALLAAARIDNVSER